MNHQMDNVEYEEDVILTETIAFLMGLVNTEAGEEIEQVEEQPTGDVVWKPPSLRIVDKDGAWVRMVPRVVWDPEDTIWLITELCNRHAVVISYGVRKYNLPAGRDGDYPFYEMGAIFHPIEEHVSLRRYGQHDNKIKAWQLAVCRAAIVFLQALQTKDQT